MAGWKGSLRGSRASRLAVALCIGAPMIALACNGTTGREGLSTGTGADPQDGGTDSAAEDDQSTGAFDVTITYADRVLPDIGAPVRTADGGGGGDSGSPWPNCPPFIPVDNNGVPTDIGDSVTEVSADYSDSGIDGSDEVPALDGSACATYGWLGSTKADSCVVKGISSGWDFFALPPCNWCVDAGLAAQGPGQGQPRYDLCIALYQCIQQSGCATTPNNVGLAQPANCLCGDAGLGDNCITVVSGGGTPGPCTTQELSALEYPASSVQDALKNFQSPSLPVPDQGSCGAPLNRVYQSYVTNKCSPDGGQHE